MANITRKIIDGILDETVFCDRKDEVNTEDAEVSIQREIIRLENKYGKDFLTDNEIYVLSHDETGFDEIVINDLLDRFPEIDTLIDTMALCKDAFLKL